ncbi:baseplate multidomain protein megatron [Celeribacter arenosi]|uniref:Glycoside hydrolase TIM-barrel-like domain-containing protein n=1 Tax=Celeribacter arenosi TaxID=792649 RepID=A0ABP7KCQ6_9RHOB
MATIVLSAVGAAAGASVGGGMLGLSSVVLGRAIGATVGRVIDQRIMGSGSRAVETGRVDRFRLNGASEGAPIPQIYGRMRVGGQVIWATQFKEHQKTSGGGKGAATSPKVTAFSYTVSLAIALCEGEVSRVGRIWADGQEITVRDLNLRLYPGTETQLPDPKIEATEGAGYAPAYRGVAYVVLEDLDLAPFGNRVPQFSFEVVRPEQGVASKSDLGRIVEAVALIPGTGEYALATEPVFLESEPGVSVAANVNSAAGVPDIVASTEALQGELGACKATSLVVSWFGTDLRCGQCEIAPKVEQSAIDGQNMPWSVSGYSRTTAGLVPRDADDRSVYGGTPTDQSVFQAIERLKDSGQEVMFYPFILMEQLAGNDLIDPWTGQSGQPALPWRGRITTSLGPDVVGSTDGTAAADMEVAAFFGKASVNDFVVDGKTVNFIGAHENSFRRMILHYAHLCAAAGGVDSFCIGSEMRSLTRIRGASGFPAVDELRRLARDVRTILGPSCKIGYAADWSEYSGYQSNGDMFFPLDPLWADPDIDFVGIDNYMPLSDWREGTDHADAAAGSIYNLDYLKAGVEGGEGYDWYYAHSEHRISQKRTPITDGAYGEPWVWRYKDIRGWWENEHHERVNGERLATPTAWQPRSKPIWFTELGCAAIDKGTNQPNKFIDEKSSESSLPHFSSGRRDDFIQMQYLRAMTGHWSDPLNNPPSDVYDGPMVDMSRAFVWAWDARPFPAFPRVTSVWSDGGNYAKGHWLNGRSTSRSLSDVVEEICNRSGVTSVDTDELWGVLRGYQVSDIDGARAALQPLMIAFGFEAIEREGRLIFRSRDAQTATPVSEESFAINDEQDGVLVKVRAPSAEIAGKVRLTFVDADSDFAARAEEAVFPDEEIRLVSQSEIPIALTRSEGRQIVERWLAESRVARDTVTFSLPPSNASIGAGDVIELDEGKRLAKYRIDHATMGAIRQLEAVRVEENIYEPSDAVEEIVRAQPFVAPTPVSAVFLDLPLLSGDEVPHAPHIAVAARPWPGSAAVYASPTDDGYALNKLVTAPATMGVTQATLPTAQAGVWDRGPALRVRLTQGELASVQPEDVLNGANVAAIGDGSSGNWEVFQFADAELVGPRTYDLRLRLRGQAGTDAIGTEWPIGSRFVLIDDTLRQLDIATSARGLARHYRIGPSGRSYDDESYTHAVEAFDGVGLRPYAPVHLSARQSGGNLEVSWVRRTRIDGDSWQSVEVPLGEAREAYVIRVFKNGVILREDVATSANWTYSAALQATDGAVAPFSIDIAQLSDTYGPGPFRRIDING